MHYGSMGRVGIQHVGMRRVAERQLWCPWVPATGCPEIGGAAHGGRLSLFAQRCQIQCVFFILVIETFALLRVHHRQQSSRELPSATVDLASTQASRAQWRA